MFVDCKQIFHPVPGLDQYAQDTISLAAGTSCHAFGHFFLDHSRTTGDQVFIIQHLEKNLTGDIVWIITRQHERFSFEQLSQVHFEKVLFNDVVSQSRKVFAQIGHGFKVEFHHFERSFLGHEELGEYSHTRSDFQDRKLRACIYGVGNVLGYLQVFQEVLSQKLLRLD